MGVKTGAQSGDMAKGITLIHPRSPQGTFFFRHLAQFEKVAKHFSKTTSPTKPHLFPSTPTNHLQIND
jgi:hypothetical protein